MPVAPAENPFVFMGLAHVAAMALTLAVPLGLSLWVRNARSRGVELAICWTLAAALVVNEVAHLVYAWSLSDLHVVVRDYLPLHVCDVVLFVTAWVLVGRNQFLYEVAYFWGIAGTVQAVITPNITAGFPAYDFFRFFISHSGIVAGVLFLTLGLGMRPRPGSVFRMVLVTNAYLAFIVLVNWTIGSNYMFLCQPPPGKSPFFFLPWPWYIPFLEAVGLALLILVYLPFYLSDRRRRDGQGGRKGDSPLFSWNLL